jgi:hypothetical protein
MRIELLEGEASCGDFATRRMAMAEAELLAAKRGQSVRWRRPRPGVLVGVPWPGRGSVFTVTPVVTTTSSGPGKSGRAP